MAYPEPIKKLIKEFQKLPGVGSKTAERLAFYILKIPKDEAFDLTNAIKSVKENVKKCSICFNLTHEDPCSICRDPKRDKSLVCVVEQPKDLISIEKTLSYRGVYHVLMGRFAPLENENPENLTIEQLIERIENSIKSDAPIKEIIIATNPTVEGDTTALYLLDKLANQQVKISRIAKGIPTGSNIEFANQAILIDALNGRTNMDKNK